MSKKVLKVAYVFLCFIIFCAKEVYGYLDPSAMTYVIQIAAGVGITVATSIGVVFYKLKRKFKKKKETEDEDEDEE